MCSRNLELLEDTENSFWKVARQMDVENKLFKLNRNLALQGELVGEGIQSNKLKLRGQTMMFFNVYDIDKSRYLPYSEYKAVLDELQLPAVPMVDPDYELEDSVEAFIKKASIESLVCKDARAEGLVERIYNENPVTYLMRD